MRDVELYEPLRCFPDNLSRPSRPPALDRDSALFGHPPDLAVADSGFASRPNERATQERGVQHVVLPRESQEKRSRLARAALRWRTATEGRIGALKCSQYRGRKRNATLDRTRLRRTMNGFGPRIVSKRAMEGRASRNEHSDPAHRLFPAPPTDVCRHFCTGK